MSWKSGKLNLLEPSGPHRACYGTPLPFTHCRGGWVGPRGGQDRCGKSYRPPGFDLRTVQPIPRCYTDWASWPTLLSSPPPPPAGDQCTSLPSLSCYNPVFSNLISLGPNIFFSSSAILCFDVDRKRHVHTTVGLNFIFSWEVLCVPSQEKVFLPLNCIPCQATWRIMWGTGSSRARARENQPPSADHICPHSSYKLHHQPT